MNKHVPSQSRILIVDDTMQNIQVLGTILKQEGYQINVAQNGVQALAMARKVPPDLILLDIMMPELDGFEACQQLKKEPAHQDIPVIFLTAKAELNHVIQGFELGAVDYITKPFNPMELLARVRTQLDLKHSRDLTTAISQERKELIHILCHDLANPMGAVYSALNLIETWQDFMQFKKLLLDAADSALHVIELVRKMRVLEERGLELQPILLHSVVEDSYHMLESKFKEKQLRFENHVPELMRVIAEPVSLVNSVLNNLLTNAIKFSYRGTLVRINAQRWGHEIEIQVQDQGKGMPQEVLRDLFSPHCTSREGTEGEMGTGFGMLLIKKFVSVYGGSIAIESRHEGEFPSDHGTLARIRLRAADAA